MFVKYALKAKKGRSKTWTPTTNLFLKSHLAPVSEAFYIENFANEIDGAGDKAGGILVALLIASDDSRTSVDWAEKMLERVVGWERNSDRQRTFHPVHRQAFVEAS